jgi:multidrug efflux system membrane fusion protein
LRYTDLVKKNVISQQQFDQAQTDAMSLRGSIKLSEAEIDQAKLQLEYAVIRAPFAGRVGSVLIHQGNVIKANDDRDLLVINQIQPIFVTFSVPEQYLPAISGHMAKEKLTVAAQVAGAEDNPEDGYLASVDNAVDRATGTIKLKGLFENKDKRLWPGQFARCALNLSMEQDVLTVPSQAIQQGLKGSFVYVAKSDNTAEFRLVETGAMLDGRTVITKGLDQGETVVTDGHVRLTPGALMEIKPEGQAS